MKRKFLNISARMLFAGLGSLCALAACKKNNNGNNNGNLVRPKQYIEQVNSGITNETDTFALSYDGNGKLTSVAGKQLKLDYSYSGNNFAIDLFENGALSIHENDFVNAALLLDSTFQYNNTNDTTTEKYHYNGSLLTSKFTYDYGSGVSTLNTRNTYTTDNSGNVTKDVEDDGQGNISTITSYTYTDKSVQFTINTDLSSLPMKNLPATMTVTEASGIPILKVTYTYVFDNSGRLTQETDAADNGATVIKSYVY